MKTDSLFSVVHYFRFAQLVWIWFASQDTFAGTDFNSRQEARRVVAEREGCQPEQVEIGLHPEAPIIQTGQEYLIGWKVELKV